MDEVTTNTQQAQAQPLNENAGVPDVGTAAWNTEATVQNGQVQATTVGNTGSYPNIASGITSTPVQYDTSGMTQQGQNAVSYQQQYQQALNDQTIQNYQNAFNQSYQEQLNANGKIDETYQQSAQDISNQYAIYRQNMGMNIANQGLNTGLGSQMQLSLNNSRNNSLAQNSVAHAQAVQAGQQALVDLELQYRTAIAEAIGNNDLTLAQTLYEEIQNDENRKLVIAQTMAQYGDYSGYQEIYGSATATAMQEAYDKAKQESKNIENAEYLAQLGDFSGLADYYDWTDEQYADATAQWIYANPGYAYYIGKITADQYYAITGQLPNSQTSAGTGGSGYGGSGYGGSGGGSGYGSGYGSGSGDGSAAAGTTTTTNNTEDTTKATKDKVIGNIKQILDSGDEEAISYVNQNLAKILGLDEKTSSEILNKVIGGVSTTGKVKSTGEADGLNDFEYYSGTVTDKSTSDSISANTTGNWTTYITGEGSLSTGDPQIDAMLNTLREEYQALGNNGLNENGALEIDPKDNEYLDRSIQDMSAAFQASHQPTSGDGTTGYVKPEMQQHEGTGEGGIDGYVADAMNLADKGVVRALNSDVMNTPILELVGQMINSTGNVSGQVQKQIGLVSTGATQTSTGNDVSLAVNGFGNKDAFGNEGMVDVNGLSNQNAHNITVQVPGLSGMQTVNFTGDGIAKDDKGNIRTPDEQILAATLAAYYGTDTVTDAMMSYAADITLRNEKASGMDLINTYWGERSLDEYRMMLQADMEAKDTGLIGWYNKFTDSDLSVLSESDVQAAIACQQAYETGSVEQAAANVAQIHDGAALSAAILNAVNGMDKLGYVNLESLAYDSGAYSFASENGIEIERDLTAIMEQYNQMQEELFGDASDPLNSWSYIAAMELQWVIGGTPTSNNVLAFTKAYTDILDTYGDNPTAEQCMQAKNRAFLQIGNALNPNFAKDVYPYLFNFIADYTSPYLINKSDINYMGYLLGGNKNISARDVEGLTDEAYLALGTALGWTDTEGAMKVGGQAAFADPNKEFEYGTSPLGTVTAGQNGNRTGTLDEVTDFWNGSGLSTGTSTKDKSTGRDKALQMKVGTDQKTKQSFLSAAAESGWDYNNIAIALNNNGYTPQASFKDVNHDYQPVEEKARARMEEGRARAAENNERAQAMYNDKANYLMQKYGGNNAGTTRDGNSAYWNTTGREAEAIGNTAALQRQGEAAAANEHERYIYDKYSSDPFYSGVQTSVSEGSAYADRQASVNGWNDYMANRGAGKNEPSGVSSSASTDSISAKIANGRTIGSAEYPVSTFMKDLAAYYASTNTGTSANTEALWNGGATYNSNANKTAKNDTSGLDAARERERYLYNKYSADPFYSGIRTSASEGSAYVDRQTSINGWNDYMANRGDTVNTGDKMDWINLMNSIGMSSDQQNALLDKLGIGSGNYTYGTGINAVSGTYGMVSGKNRNYSGTTSANTTNKASGNRSSTKTTSKVGK